MKIYEGKLVSNGMKIGIVAAMLKSPGFPVLSRFR